MAVVEGFLEREVRFEDLGAIWEIGCLNSSFCVLRWLLALV